MDNVKRAFGDAGSFLTRAVQVKCLADTIDVD